MNFFLGNKNRAGFGAQVLPEKDSNMSYRDKESIRWVLRKIGVL